MTNQITPIVLSGVGTVTPGNDGSVELLTALSSVPNDSGVYVTRFIIDASDSSLTGAEALILNIGNTQYPVLLRNGSPLQIGRLRRRQLMYLQFHNESNAHFTVLNAVGGLILRIPQST